MSFRTLTVASLASALLVAPGCDLILTDLGTLSSDSLSFADRTEGTSRWFHGWESGPLLQPAGDIRGSFAHIAWPAPREALPDASIEGRVLRFNIEAGSRSEGFAMTFGGLWLPPRDALKPGQPVVVSSDDVRMIGCGATEPGMWDIEKDPTEAQAIITLDAEDPNLMHVEVVADFGRSNHLVGRVTARLPGTSLIRW
jgi:hypothetical protein